MLVMRVLAVIASVLLVVGVLWDGFETVVLPRRVSRRFRLTRLYFRSTWHSWSRFARHAPVLERRENFLAIYGPLALLLLLALWSALLIVGYALLLWGLGSPLSDPALRTGSVSFWTDVYFSGTTFLTLGLGDVFPHAVPARILAVLEVGTGFGILALVIGYLPVLYQAFSRRETRISLLDGHAGSPPTAGALLLRHPPDRHGRARRLTTILAEWEGWSAELLETHLSYPVLAYYRSQHEDQSWVAALTVILDTCALVLACGRGLLADDQLTEQAAFTFAMARHATVDLAQVFSSRGAAARPRESAMKTAGGRLLPAERARLRSLLAGMEGATTLSDAGMPRMAEHDEADRNPEAGKTPDAVAGTLNSLDALRALYEHYLEDLGAYLLMDLPPWIPTPDRLDDWQSTADGVTAPSVTELVDQQHAQRTTHTQPTLAPGHASE